MKTILGAHFEFVYYSGGKLIKIEFEFPLCQDSFAYIFVTWLTPQGGGGGSTFRFHFLKVLVHSRSYFQFLSALGPISIHSRSQLFIVCSRAIKMGFLVCSIV